MMNLNEIPVSGDLQLKRSLRVCGAAISVFALASCDIMLEPIEEVPSPPPLPTATPTGTATPEPEETVTAPDPVPSDTDEVDGEDETDGQGVDVGEEIDPVPEDGSDTEDALEPEPIVEPTPEPTANPEPAPNETPTPEPTLEEAAFEYYPVGDLAPNSGTGTQDTTVYVPDMVFPIKDAPAYPQSQVYRYGGGILGGDQCDVRNFTSPWRDNYCEKRSRTTTTPYCPNAGVHVGQDIRVGTPEGCNAERRTSASERKRYVVVASEDGYISNIGSYTVNVRAGGRIYRYMHMNMRALEVEFGQQVKAGDVLGYVSNDFGGTPTTLHLHFEIKHNTAEHGWTWAPPYTSLVKAYERREKARGERVELEE